MTRPLLLLCLALAAVSATAADASKALHDFFTVEWVQTVKEIK